MSLTNSLSKAKTSSGKTNQKAFSNGKGGKGKLGGIMGSVGGTTKNVAGTIKGVGNIVASAAGALGFTGLQEALTGKTTINYNKPSGESSGLKGFYNHFSGFKYVDRIDPLVTFDCKFEFFPSVFSVMTASKKVTEHSTFSSDGQELIKTKSPTFQAGSTVTGDKSTSSVILQLLELYQVSNTRTKMIDNKTETETTYDSEVFETDSGTLKKGYEIETTSTQTTFGFEPLIFDIYIQKVTIPQLQIEGGEDITTLVGKFPVPGNIVVPDSNTFQIEVINTKAPIIENIFYPWMRESTLPKWVYDEQPFTTANISFDFTEHANIIYHFFGCRPTSIQLLHPDQAPMTNLTRQVQFTFDFMTIETTFKTVDGKFTGMGGDMSGAKKDGQSTEGLLNSILFSAANTLKL